MKLYNLIKTRERQGDGSTVLDKGKTRGRFYRPIALYYDSILVGLEKLALNKDIGYTFENIKSKEDNYIVKIMCWDSMTKLIPLNNCEVATVQQ